MVEDGAESDTAEHEAEGDILHGKVVTLKMASNCYTCILDRAKFEGDLVFSEDEDEKKMEVMEDLLDFMACHKRGVPALVGTERERIVKRRSGNCDPYLDLKAGSNRLATGLLPRAREFYDGAEDKLEALVRIAAAANSMEFGVKGHSFDNATFGGVFQSTLKERLEGDLCEVERRLKSFDRVLYLTDNAGEVVFDLFVVGKLLEMGKRVIMAPKAEPVLNDVTAAELSGMTSNEIVPTGPVVGLSLDEANPAFLDLLFDPRWLIIAKGMGNFETMTEFDLRLKGRLVYILRAKCEPVANKIGVPKGTLVVRSV